MLLSRTVILGMSDDECALPNRFDSRVLLQPGVKLRVPERRSKPIFFSEVKIVLGEINLARKN